MLLFQAWAAALVLWLYLTHRHPFPFLPLGNLKQLLFSQHPDTGPKYMIPDVSICSFVFKLLDYTFAIAL